MTEEQIKKMWYIYARDCYSSIKKECNNAFVATWMDLESVILREVSQTKEKYHMTSLICVIQKEMIQMNLPDKETHRLRKQIYGCGGEVIVRDFGMVMYTLLYLKWIINKNLLYSAGNSAQRHVAACMGGGFGGEWIHVCMSESLQCSP